MDIDFNELAAQLTDEKKEVKRLKAVRRELETHYRHRTVDNVIDDLTTDINKHAKKARDVYAIFKTLMEHEA